MFYPTLQPSNIEPLFHSMTTLKKVVIEVLRFIRATNDIEKIAETVCTL